MLFKFLRSIHFLDAITLEYPLPLFVLFDDLVSHRCWKWAFSDTTLATVYPLWMLYVVHISIRKMSVIFLSILKSFFFFSLELKYIDLFPVLYNNIDTFLFTLYTLQMISLWIRIGEEGFISLCWRSFSNSRLVTTIRTFLN